MFPSDDITMDSSGSGEISCTVTDFLVPLSIILKWKNKWVLELQVRERGRELLLSLDLSSWRVYSMGVKVASVFTAC